MRTVPERQPGKDKTTNCWVIYLQPPDNLQTEDQSIFAQSDTSGILETRQLLSLAAPTAAHRPTAVAPSMLFALHKSRWLLRA